MKKLLILCLTFLACVAFSGQASALSLSLTDSYYLGSIDDGINASEANETLWVNALKIMGDSTSGLNYDGTPSGQGPELLTRSGNSWVGDLPDAVFYDKDEIAPIKWLTMGNSFDYVLGKFGAGNETQISYVWYTGGLDWSGETEITISADQRLSHMTVFNGTSVPEPAGMFLLGTGLISLAALGRKKFRK